MQANIANNDIPVIEYNDNGTHKNASDIPNNPCGCYGIECDACADYCIVYYYDCSDNKACKHSKPNPMYNCYLEQHDCENESQCNVVSALLCCYCNGCSTHESEQSTHPTCCDYENCPNYPHKQRKMVKVKWLTSHTPTDRAQG